jgi:hypothetical protein
MQKLNEASEQLEESGGRSITYKAEFGAGKVIARALVGCAARAATNAVDARGCAILKQERTTSPHPATYDAPI